MIGIEQKNKAVFWRPLKTWTLKLSKIKERIVVLQKYLIILQQLIPIPTLQAEIAKSKQPNETLKLSKVSTWLIGAKEILFSYRFLKRRLDSLKLNYKNSS